MGEAWEEDRRGPRPVELTLQQGHQEGPHTSYAFTERAGQEHGPAECDVLRAHVRAELAVLNRMVERWH